MTDTTIYQDIETRTGGDIYIGVVGPVRTGKSTFIKKFMETLVIPNIDSAHKKERAQDELPQSAAGRTIMTTEPKFIPEEAVKITLPENAALNVRLFDCVGYIVPSSLGYIENEQPRMVKTPWFDDEIPFNMAAEIGTQKVITEHSTIGLVVTTDGSISEIPREEYQEAEERVVDELKEKGYTLSLATSPIFPLVGVKERLSWIGLTPEDFGVVTSYENCHFAKPELGYYKEVLNAAGFTAGESLMVGNDLKDDMPAGELGVQTFLVTDVLENKQEGFEEKYTHGTFSQLKEFLENLPDIKG